MSTYNHKEIEGKWRKIWSQTQSYKIKADSSTRKFYCLDMVPYPSGSGLHVGHLRGYVLSDLWSRYKTLQGYQVLHPMACDAFGLPVENDGSIKGVHSGISTAQNIADFKRQLQEMGAMYDWDREINTTDPKYLKWTQWIFLQMYKRGLAYRREMPIRFCPSCQADLANEEVVSGECKRCGSAVEKKHLQQWMLKNTAYADRLLDGLTDLDWPKKVLKMQEEWIGRSEGAEITFALVDSAQIISVYTTRPDTLFGATYLVLAPEHELAMEITTADQQQAVRTYIEKSIHKSSVERMASKEKTGVFTGSYGINPVNNEAIPIWISDDVLIDYGLGAIMAVPAHDQRDYEFAKVFDLPILPVITDLNGDISELPYVMDGKLVNSNGYDNLTTADAARRIVTDLEKQDLAEATVKYKMRDWVFSRQHYWGEPIPIVHCNDCGEVPLPESQLPLRLSDVDNYKPSGKGESSLAAIKDWVHTTCPSCGGAAKRETYTMPHWAGSCWYFLRYLDPHNTVQLADPAKIKYWAPVDLYVGGDEHAVLHLLSSRFYTMFLNDIGVIDFAEPFTRVLKHGMVTKEGTKMSKCKGNVVNLDQLVEHYGADSVRVYELFIGPPEVDAEWMDTGIEGVYRFIQRVWNLFERSLSQKVESTIESERRRHQLIATVTERIESFRLNTAVSAFMSYLNAVGRVVDRKSLETLALLLAPMAPHLAEELWYWLGHKSTIFQGSWPKANPDKLVGDEITIAIQVNGKTRGTVTVPADATEDAVQIEARELTAVRNSLDGREIVKVIYVSGKILNLVLR